MASNKTTPVSIPPLPANHTPITRLPPYFPTTSKHCAPYSEPFFVCFEDRAVMQTPTDTETPKLALLQCQAELLVYQQCMEQEEARKKAALNKKPWWKVW